MYILINDVQVRKKGAIVIYCKEVLKRKYRLQRGLSHVIIPSFILLFFFFTLTLSKTVFASPTHDFLLVSCKGIREMSRKSIFFSGLLFFNVLALWQLSC